MRYRYFVSYVMHLRDGRLGHGNGFVLMDAPITTPDHVQSLTSLVGYDSDDRNPLPYGTKVIVMNFVLMAEVP